MKKQLLALLFALLLMAAGCSQGADPVPVHPNPTPSPALAAPEHEASPGECTQTAPPGYTPIPAQTSGVSFGAFTTWDLDGNEVTDAIFSEHTLTMVNIWGTFCGPCLYEMPFLGELHQEYADRGFAVMGIVTDVTDRNLKVVDSQVTYAKELVEETGAYYLHLVPSEDLMRIKLNDVMYIPETVFVDQYGNVVDEPIVSAKEKSVWAGIIEEKLGKVGA